MVSVAHHAHPCNIFSLSVIKEGISIIIKIMGMHNLVAQKSIRGSMWLQVLEGLAPLFCGLNEGSEPNTMSCVVSLVNICLPFFIPIGER